MKFPCKRSFSYLSNYTQMASDSLEWSVSAGEIEDACAAERLDFVSDLNSVLLGKLPRFLLKRNIHLPSLSMETILESQFVDDFTVKKILSEVNKEWLKTKPLQLVGSNIAGKPFIDKPPKRVMMTNMSVEECQRAFKSQVCDYLTDFCQLLNSDELLSFFMEDVVDTSAKRRFDHFKHQLEKNVEKWCEDLKKTDFPLKGLSITLQKQTGKSEKSSKRPEYDMSIERELDEIIRSQLNKYDEDGPATKRRRTCANQSLDLEDVLNAQMMNANSAYGDNKADGSSVENLSPTQTNLEKEFDVFTEELASFCDNKETKKGIDNLYSPIHHIEDNLYENFEDSIVMANINKTSDKKRDELTDDNESYGGDGFDKNDSSMSKSKVVSRSIRKKRLDKEDQQENNQKRHKRKKDDKKHKLKKRKKNKHKDVENVKGKLLSLKCDERDVMRQREKHIRDQLPGKFDNKVLPRVNKTFEPDMKLYEDSHLSCGFDVYQKQKIIELLEMNFESEFDPTLPPGEVCESPLMQLFTDSSGVMEQFVGIIPDIRQFCTDLVNSKNAFLWALSLATCDPGVPNKISDDENLKKQSAKTTGNPLIQAFRQAVEANKKKDDRISKSAYLKRGKNQPKISFKSTGLSSLFRLNSNLKSSSKEIISSAFNRFHDEVTDLAKTENFADSSLPEELDFSAISTHFEKASQAMHALYAASEESLSSRVSTKKELIMMSNVNISPTDNVSNGNLVDTQADSSTASVAQPTTEHQTIADSTVTQSEAQLIASTAYANYVTSKTTSAASSKGYTPTAKYTSSSMYTAAPGTISASPLAYSGYAYNPYSAMHYSQATWAYQAGYMPGYMPDLSSMQAYQNMALQSYPMMASAQVVPTVDMMQALQPVTTTADEVLSDGTIAVASGGGVLDESKTGSGKKVNRPPKNTRVYIFKNDSALSKDVERYLDNIGLKKFDLYNLTLLRHLPNFECLIFIQQEDSKYVNQIPGLLRLKRDLRVVFVTYNILDDVMNKQYTMIFPRAGMVLMDESALIACKSEVLDGLCQFMRKQTFEKGTAWKLLITSNTFKILDQLTYQLEDDIEEHVRITEVSQILQTYKTTGIVEVLSDEFHMSDPKSTADYQACFLALQRARHGSCRHFLFVTDMPRNHPDAKMFLTNGIDIMNVVEFMRCFVSKAVVHSPKVFESFVTRYTPEKYLDAPISDCSQTITF